MGRGWRLTWILDLERVASSEEAFLVAKPVMIQLSIRSMEDTKEENLVDLEVALEVVSEVAVVAVDIEADLEDVVDIVKGIITSRFKMWYWSLKAQSSG